MYKGAFLSVRGLRFLCLGYCGQFHKLGTEATGSMQALASMRWHKGDTQREAQQDAQRFGYFKPPDE